MSHALGEPYEMEFAKHREVVDGKLAEFEEKQKSREPNVISAIRTFLDDWRDYSAGIRPDFPQEAFIGVVSAWMRPRIVIIFGSILALLLAAAEFWLIYNQNRIIERQAEIMADQNKLVEQQSRLSRVQAASALLPALQSADGGVSQQAQFVLAAYGDVLFDILMPVIKLGLPQPRSSFASGEAPPARELWLNAVAIVVDRKELLPNRDRVELLFILIEAADSARWLVQSHAMDHLNSSGESILPVTPGQRTVKPGDQNTVLYRRISGLLGSHVLDMPDLELTGSEWRRALEGIARMYAFSYRYRFDPYETMWIEQGAGLLGSGVGDRLCSRAWERSDGSGDIVETLPMLLQESLSRLESTPAGFDSDRAIRAVAMYACAPQLLVGDSAEDQELISLARRALPFIKHAEEVEE